MLGSLIFLLLPAGPSFQEAARRGECKNRMKQLALAMHNWQDAHDRLPDLRISENGNPARSWRVDILDYGDEAEVRRRYRDDRSWNDSANLDIAKTRLDVYTCPSVSRVQNLRDVQQRCFTHFLAVTGPDTVFANGKGMSLEDLSNADGTSKTLFLVEAVGRNIVWTEPRDADTGQQPMGLNVPGDTVFDSPGFASAYHPAGVNMAFADGTVSTIPKTMAPDVLRAMTTAHGGEPTDRGF